MAPHYLAAAGACALTTLLALPLLGRVDLANIVLVFVLAVVLVATFLGRGPAILASFLAVACFDFFFVPPRFSFTVEHAQYLITFAVMLAVSLVISHLSNAYREKAIEAGQRADESALLHDLSSALAGAMTFGQVAERLRDVVQRRLAAEAILHLAGDDGKVAPVGDGNVAIGMPEQMTAQGVYASGEPVHGNRDLDGGRPTTLLPLAGSARRYGVLEIRGSEASAGLLASIAAAVATAVERIHFVEVAQASTLAMQTERLRSSLLSVISHDLRTPLTVLYGIADSLAESAGLSDDQRQAATTLRDQSHRLHRMVDNLLDMARLKSGRIELRREWQSVPELVGASVQAMAPWFGERRVRFDWPADLPLVEADALLIERVFCNLLENAGKYSPPASTVTVGARVDERDPGRLLIWVDNDGEGFPPDRIADVFELFARGSEESAVPGVGVGLAVCRAIVEAHQGSIAATNREGGARVNVALPLQPSPPVPDESEAPGGGANHA